jgi:hypothetical protein
MTFEELRVEMEQSLAGDSALQREFNEPLSMARPAHHSDLRPIESKPVEKIPYTPGWAVLAQADPEFRAMASRQIDKMFKQAA